MTFMSKTNSKTWEIKYRLSLIIFRGLNLKCHQDLCHVWQICAGGWMRYDIQHQIAVNVFCQNIRTEMDECRGFWSFWSDSEPSDAIFRTEMTQRLRSMVNISVKIGFPSTQTKKATDFVRALQVYRSRVQSLSPLLSFSSGTLPTSEFRCIFWGNLRYLTLAFAFRVTVRIWCPKRSNRSTHYPTTVRTQTKQSDGTTNPFDTENRITCSLCLRFLYHF